MDRVQNTTIKLLGQKAGVPWYADTLAARHDPADLQAFYR